MYLITFVLHARGSGFITAMESSFVDFNHKIFAGRDTAVFFEMIQIRSTSWQFFSSTALTATQTVDCPGHLVNVRKAGTATRVQN